MSDSRLESRQLFQDELEALKEARKRLEMPDVTGSQLEEPYRKLVEQYGKLLRTSMKLSRISDIQGRTLIEREHEIRVANESLKEMEQLRRDVISDIAHELGTPMTALQGYVKALLDGIVPLDRHYLQTMYDKVLIMNQLIEDLFEMARLKGSRMGMQLRDLLLEDVVEPLSRFGLQEAEKKNVRLDVHPLSTPAPEGQTAIVKADLIRIEQVMNNLVGNALKFTPPGGTVQIRFLLESPPDPGRWERSLPEGASLPGAALVVEVEDTGMGIPKEELPHVFERFYRGTFPKAADIEGSGLGLAIAKEIMARHGGAIGADSRWSRGSVFYFTLPVQMIGDDKIL
ncbi:sensor histidine kinase [Gorillibacterium sp. sgz5001074]|uniref:sensor histidine kinase n=1 Tax=Gorillibacterium sp. sgz5001074 TaxID=3446695 RepID=UPI003F669CF0